MPFLNIYLGFIKDFEAPKNFVQTSLNSTYALLKWTLSAENVEEIYKKINNFQEKSYLVSKIPRYQLFREVYFELYLKEKSLDLTHLNSDEIDLKNELEQHQKKIQNSIFRTFLSGDLIQSKSNENMRESEMIEENDVTFAYNLTNLIPNTQYVFEISARISNVESYASKPLTLKTLRKFNKIFTQTKEISKDF